MPAANTIRRFVPPMPLALPLPAGKPVTTRLSRTTRPLDRRHGGVSHMTNPANQWRRSPHDLG
jgi:hypothetical protein